MIKIIGLVENTTCSPSLRCEHGLSLYIETTKHKILFDVGPDELLEENAAKLSVDLKSIDIVVISHGHNDHGGGLKAFMKINPKAKIYIRKSAFEPHFSDVNGTPVSISLDPECEKSNQIVYSDNINEIDDELYLFSNVTAREFYSHANDQLLVLDKNRYIHDSFTHEQYLVIRDNHEDTLVTGCSHCGIVNIVEQYRKLYDTEGTRLKTVIGGFHLYSPRIKKYETDELIDAVAQKLLDYHADFFTCHCTGIYAYERMKTIMGNRLNYLSVGTELKR